MNKKIEYLRDYLEKESPKDTNNNVPEMPLCSCASNLPACGGPIYSNTFWLPEDAEELLDNLSD